MLLVALQVTLSRQVQLCQPVPAQMHRAEEQAAHLAAPWHYLAVVQVAAAATAAGVGLH